MTQKQEATRAMAMKEYFTNEELDIIHHALAQYLKELEPLKGYTIWNQTKNLTNVTFPLICFKDITETPPSAIYSR